MKASRLSAAAGLCGVLALATAGAATAGAGAPATASGNHASAVSDAHALLGRARLPPGAVALAGPPPGAGAIERDVPNEATPNLLDAHSWWRAAGTLDAVLDYVKAHPPSGSSSSGSGGSSTLVYPGSSTTATVEELTFAFAPRSGVLASRTLIVTATRIGAGVSAVRVDAEDVWVTPRSASERIPAGVHEVDVTRALPGRPPSVSAHVVGASKVAAIVSLIDDLGVVQPGAVNCPMIPAGAPVVTMAFRAKRGGAVLAQASQLALAIGVATPCDPVRLTIGGRQQPPLLAGSGFLAALGKLLGLKLAATAPA